MKDRRSATAVLRCLLGDRFEELGGACWLQWPQLKEWLSGALLKKLEYSVKKERAWDNRVGRRHLKRGGMDETRVRSARPSDYGEAR